eukprot:CAMPEP_0206229072 /NCGR_PEP_ID=MMETSP0047_2-20121206/9500_1 /ASSEMBLY_ACC=CAM_ASM_000192 /TAXON_ID=195065 /ORGANISM="Chroomonas mesostigmatica_cf, Strain CCMP1168" /LENGTH=326 /DNA_ID=CAMNT_0053652343 /DNA_START=190 /DNA_END=1170 /DNA_ORIENTATION=+
MRAVVQDEYGEADVLQIREAPVPTPGKGEVLIKVHAAGLHKGDWHMMAGNPYVMRLATGISRPKKGTVVGSDVAGVVEEVGPGVDRFKKGDEVWGTSGMGGGWAEYAKAKADDLALKPSNLSYEQCAVTATSACTALQAVTTEGKVQAGHKVLVLGASGGVGIYAVQMAKALGAEVTAVCSAGKFETVKSLGAEHLIDYKQAPDVTERGVVYDVIIDCGGSRKVDALRKILAARGSYVLVGGEGGSNFLPLGRQFYCMVLSSFVKQRLAAFVNFPTPPQMDALRADMEAGKLKSIISETFPLDQAPEAMRKHTAGAVTGKVAIKVV